MRQNVFTGHYFTVPIKSSQFCPSIQIENLEPNICYVLCWVDGKFSIKNLQPIFKVCFRKVEKFSNDGGIIRLSEDDFIYTSLSISPLKYLSIGSVVLNNKKVAEIDLPNSKIKIDGKYHEASLSGLSECVIIDAPLFSLPNTEKSYKGVMSVLTSLIPRSFFSYEDFLVFKKSDGGNFYITKVEYFLSLFGVSTELKRVLLSNTYLGIIDTFKLKNNLEETPQYWYVPSFSSTKYLEHDAVLLAHLKYTKETQIAVKKLTTSLLTNKINSFISSSQKLSIKPWHNQPIEMVVSGFPIKGSKDFFVSKIQAFSDPLGKDIIIQKDKNEKTTGLGVVTDERNNPIKRITKLDSNIPIISTGVTDSSVMNAEIPLHLQIIGQARKITIENILRYCSYSSTPITFGQEANAYSDAPPIGSDLGIGALTPKAKHQDENTIDDIQIRSYVKEALDASNKLLEEGVFKLVEYYDGEKFQNDNEFGVFEIKAKGKHKSSINNKVQPFRGHSLLLKLHTNTDTYFCMELQSLSDTKKYSGLLVKTTNVTNEKALVETLINAVISHNGIFKRIATGVISSETKVYRHGQGAVEKRFREFCLNVH